MNSTVESRLIAALTDTAQRNLPDSLSPAALDSSATSLPTSAAGSARTTGRSTGRGRRLNHWVLPVLAAAVVVALAAVALVAGERISRPATTPAAGGPGIEVTLQADPAGGTISSTQLRQARDIIARRAAALGLQPAEVTVSGQNELVADLPKATSDQVEELVAVDALQFRALIMEPVIAAGSPQTAPAPQPTGRPAGAPSVNPWRALNFKPPVDADGFARLTQVQQTAIGGAVQNWDCRDSAVVPAGQPSVGCSVDGTTKYVLGPPIVDAGEVASAQAVSDTAVQSDWPINIELRAAGQQRWSAYTARHNQQVRPGAVDNQVADTLDGQVLVVSTIESQIAGTTQMLSGLDRQGAKRLSAMLSNQALPFPFRIVATVPR